MTVEEVRAEAPSLGTLRLQLRIPANPEILWGALLGSQRNLAWWPEFEAPSIGAEVTYTTEWDRYLWNDSFTWAGSIQAVHDARLLVFVLNGPTNPPIEEYIRIEFAPDPEGTTFLTISHEGCSQEDWWRWGIIWHPALQELSGSKVGDTADQWQRLKPRYLELVSLTQIAALDDSLRRQSSEQVDSTTWRLVTLLEFNGPPPDRVFKAVLQVLESRDLTRRTQASLILSSVVDLDLAANQIEELLSTLERIQPMVDAQARHVISTILGETYPGLASLALLRRLLQSRDLDTRTDAVHALGHIVNRPDSRDELDVDTVAEARRLLEEVRKNESDDHLRSYADAAIRGGGWL